MSTTPIERDLNVLDLEFRESLLPYSPALSKESCDLWSGEGAKYAKPARDRLRAEPRAPFIQSQTQVERRLTTEGRTPLESASNRFWN